MLKKLTIAPVSVLALAVVTLLNCTACSLYSSDTKQTYADAEGRVPERLLNELSNPNLGKLWLLAQLGPPLQNETVGTGHSVYTWALTREDTQRRQFLLLYKTQKTLRQRDYLHVVFSGDQVLKHWLDRDAAVDKKSLFSRRESAKMATQTENLSEPASAGSPSLGLSEAGGLIVPRKPNLAAAKKTARHNPAYSAPQNSSAVVTTIHAPTATAE